MIQLMQDGGCLEWKAPVLYVLVYSMIAMMSWNVIFTVSKPRCEQAVLIDKEKNVHWHKGHRSVNYFFTAEKENKEQIHGSVVGLYEMAEIGDMVTVCHYESIFGIEYFEFQIPK